MSEPHDKKTQGGSHTGEPTTAEPRRVVQPLSVVRGSRPQQSAPATDEAPARVEPYRSTGASATMLLQLWALLNQRQRWSSLVVVPSHPNDSARLAAEAILEVGSKQNTTPVRFLDAEGLELGAAAHVVNQMKVYVEQGDRVVVLLDSLITNPVGLEVALSAERALLSVALGTSDFSSARRTIELIGKERFLGSVTVQPPSGAPKK